MDELLAVARQAVEYLREEGRHRHFVKHADEIITTTKDAGQMANEALKDLVSTIEATGGIKRDKKGYPVPVGDEEWIDLGECYLKACAALGKEPVENEEPFGGSHAPDCPYRNGGECDCWRSDPDQNSEANGA